MSDKNYEILAIIVITGLLALMVVGFIVAMLMQYKKRQHQHKVELAELQDEYDQQILKVQFEMQEAVLAEISNKLHDALKNNIHGIANSVQAISMMLKGNMIGLAEAVERLDDISKDLVVVKEEVRLTSHSLSSDRISQVGLIDAIRHELRRLQQNKQIEVLTAINDGVSYNFRTEESVYLFRMFQECVGNVLAHAKAKLMQVNIGLLPGNDFYLEIIDDGIGFDPAEKKKSKLSGIGLSGMQKRALQIGATFDITSRKNEGTKVKIQLHLTTQTITNARNPQQVKEAKYSFN